MSSDIFVKIEEMTDTDFKRWIGWILIAAVVVLSIAFGAYLAFFHEQSLVADAGAWAQFGDFIGGSVNPIIGFLTLLALVLTLVIQNKQLRLSARELELSRRELELTRQELERSAKAQELSEKALRAQANVAERTAQLTTLNFLLQSYRSEIKGLQEMAFSSASLHARRLQTLLSREGKLNNMVDNLFVEVADRKDEESI